MLTFKCLSCTLVEKCKAIKRTHLLCAVLQPDLNLVNVVVGLLDFHTGAIYL